MTEEVKPKGEEKMDVAAILEKSKSGQELTPTEREFVAGNPDFETEPPVEEGAEGAEETTEGDEKDAGTEASPEPTKTGEETTEGEEEEVAEGVEGAEASEKETPSDDPKERRKLIDAELSKPEHLADLSKFTPVEIGLYHEMRRERKRRYKAEGDKRVLEFRELQRTLKDEEKRVAEEAIVEEDPLEGRDDDDVLTVADVKKILGKGKAKPAEKKPEAKPIITVNDLRVQKVEADSKLRAKGITDFFDVVDFAAAALDGDEDARDDLRQAALEGRNVAEATYWLVKGSKKWAEIEKKLKPAAKKVDPANEDRARRIEKNGTKVRTTGSSSGGGAVGEYTVGQLMRMSPAEFGRLPKKTQASILEKYGSEPNLSV